MCWSQYPPNVSQKKSKDKRFDILHYRNCLFWVCTRNDNISRGCDKNGISRGEGGPFCEPILENPDGRVAQKKFLPWWTMDIFWMNFDHQSGIDVEEKILFRIESHVFAGEEF